MSYASKPVASRHRAQASSPISARSHLAAGGALASAGILALGLVAVPPDSNGARTEVRAVQLAAVSLSPTAYLGALEKFISNQVQTALAVTDTAVGGIADVPAADASRLLTFDSTIAPETDNQQLNNAGPAATPTAVDFGSILGPLINNPIVGPIVLIGGFAFVFLVVVPVLWFVETVASVLGLPPVLPLLGALTATAEANTTVGPALMSEPLVKDSAPAITAKAALEDELPAAEHGKADVSPPLTSKKDVAETTKTDEVSTEPSAAPAAEPSDSDSTSEPTKSTERPATPRAVVRNSLGTEKKTSDSSHRGNGGRATTEGPAGGRAATAGSSSADSPSTDGTSVGGGSSDGDADGSE